MWVELGESRTQTLRATTGRDMAEIRFTPLEIIYNKIYSTIQIHIKEKPLQQTPPTPSTRSEKRYHFPKNESHRPPSKG
jgi:hypothetical protein